MSLTRNATRRRFLTASAGTLAAAPVLLGCSAGQSSAQPASAAPQAIGQPMPGRVELPQTPPGAPATDSVGIAVIGLGGYALRQMMPAILRTPRCHVAAIVSGNAEKAAQVGAAYGLGADSIYSYENFERIADNPRVDAAYIILPTGLHALWAEKAFAAGKHVLCEKPMAITAAECERMIAAANAASRKLMIGYRCHFEPYNLRAMALMRENALGAARLIRTDQQYVMGPTTPAENWRVNRALAGGGPLEDYGIYFLQAALYLSGEMPVSVTAATFSPDGDARFSEIFAHVAYQFDFPSGAVAQLSTSYDAAGRNRVELIGDGGSLMMDPATSYSGNTLRVATPSGAEQMSLGESGIQFTAMLEHFAAALRDGADISVGGEMGLRDVRLMEAIYASAARGAALALNPDATLQ
jgi:glucose-fructose oxidoreductase